jgi:hypothetical protein
MGVGISLGHRAFIHMNEMLDEAVRENGDTVMQFMKTVGVTQVISISTSFSLLDGKFVHVASVFYWEIVDDHSDNV